jgi:hypothetical protein
MAPNGDRKKSLEEEFAKADQPPREVLSQVRMVDLSLDAVPMFKAQDLRHYSRFPFYNSANESLSSPAAWEYGNHGR